MRPVFASGSALDIIETWAQGCEMIREFEIGPGSRVDAVLLPVGDSAPMMKGRCKGDYVGWWERCGLVGVEVKVKRADFLRGLKSGQYERYAGLLSGLYVATSLQIAKTKELPAGVGHLVLTHKTTKPGAQECICRRHPKWRKSKLKEPDMWRLFRRAFEHLRSEKREIYKYKNELAERVGAVMSHRLARGIGKVVDALAEEVSERRNHEDHPGG